MKPDFTLNLMQWNASGNFRKMPWKGENDPYKIWLSEIILQQTRVEQGWAYYERFIHAYPTLTSLAAAPESEVYKMWEGLGYYSRCRNLIQTARSIADLYGGIFPSAYKDILLLKGIGPYTAAAISSFAFNENRAVVDGNVQRVLARYFGICTPIDTTEGKKLFATLAQTLIDEDAPALYNQAIMDFGATVCKPRNPLCLQCVQSADCEAFRHGFVELLPVKEKVLNRRSRWFYYFIVQFGDSVYIRKRQHKDIWQNLYEFVLLETVSEETDPASKYLKELLPQQSYALVYSGGMQRQQLTHQQIQGRFYIVRVGSEASLGPAYMLVKKERLKEFAFPKFINSFLETNPF